jgi:hypothetical protein
MNPGAAGAQDKKVFLLGFLQKKTTLSLSLKSQPQNSSISRSWSAHLARLFPAQVDRYVWPSVSVPSGRMTLPTVLNGGLCV